MAIPGVLDEHCSEAFFAFWLQDSLEKSRWQGSSTIIARIHVLHSRTRFLLKSREASSLQNIMYFQQFSNNGYSFQTNYECFRRWVMLASSWELWIYKNLILFQEVTHVFEDEPCWHQAESFEFHANLIHLLFCMTDMCGSMKLVDAAGDSF